MDKATNQPKGSAIGYLATSHDVDAAIKLMNGNDFGGRPVRIERGDADKKRRSAGGVGYGGGESRYFLNNLSLKCSSCGQVGHRGGTCGVEAEIPCHLCARCDHDPGRIRSCITLFINSYNESSFLTLCIIL